MTAEGPIDLSTLPARIHELVDGRATDAPEAPALIEQDGTTLSYDGLAAAVTAMADMLRDAGVRGGDRVLIINENSIAAITALFAASRLDAWAVLVNARLAPAEIDRIRDHALPRAMIFTHLVSAEAKAHADRYGATERTVLGAVAIRLVGGLPARTEPVHASNTSQVAVLIYTSGTTGEPKAVMLTHLNLLYVAAVSVAVRGTNSRDTVISVIPIAHVFGLASVLLGAMRGGAKVLLFSRLDPARLADALEAGATVLQGVPALYARLLDYLAAAGRELKVPRLRYLSAGGAPLDIDWKRSIEALFGTQLHNGYGLTETSSTAGITRIGVPHDDDSIGFPAPGVRIRIVDNHGADRPDGEVGEVLIRGPNVMKGYYRNEAATRAAFTEDRWLRTGDLGYRAPDRSLFIVGRSKELIIRSGFNVYPIEVETALNAHPAVIISAVIGRKVSGNEEVIAFIETAAGIHLDAETMKSHLADRLAAYKRPQQIFVIDKLPAGPTGKILKHRLVPLVEPAIGGGRAPSHGLRRL